MSLLKSKKILVGATGSIAVYKSVELTRRLVEQGASVHVVLTDAARRFITPLTFEAVSRNAVHTDLYGDPMAHISLTADADLLVIAPATANSIGKFSNGIADDLLSTCMLSFRGPVVVAPAMNWRMYDNPVVQENLRRLLSRGACQVGPERGSLACGDEAPGRMAEVAEILEQIRSALSPKDLAGRHVLVTAGPTREYLDPVRFLSNRSSGKMGFALARAAARRGARITLVSGPTHLPLPAGISVVPAETAAEMRDAVFEHLPGCDALVMAAAVADFVPETREKGKIGKTTLSSIRLKAAPDILAEVGALEERPLLVGFSAETGHDIDRAKRKMREKGADIMVFNDVLARGSGFDSETNEITIIERERVTPLPLMTKDEAAEAVFDKICELLP